MKTPPSRFNKRVLVAGGVIAAIVLFSYGGYRYYTLNTLLERRVTEFQKEVASLQALIASTTADLASAKEENSKLAQTLQAEQGKNSLFETQIKEISGTVGTLKKLSETDPELLKKYSKVYFLSENYAPAQVSSIDSQYLFNKNRPQLIHSQILSYLTGLLEAAKRDGVTLQVVSGYRSFYEQVSVKTGYEIVYGAGTANQFSAEQGYSEHQLGTAVDFTDTETKGLSSSFEKAAAYRWLTDNAYRFGFVLSYPKNNSYYIFEPWHWRFVGQTLANLLHLENRSFYKLDQREIDNYLVYFFD
jgi:D-alanyl-D-alanine carboxypeptidase